MELMFITVLLVAGFYVGWNIGANDAANCIGTAVGCGAISYRRAAILMGLFVILGGVLQGHHVMKTVGKGIVVTSEAAYESHNKEPVPAEFDEHFPDDRLPDLAILVALVSAGFFVTLATFFSVPVSTSQAIVGGVAGVGVGLVGLEPEYFKLAVLGKILGAWMISPVLTATLAFGVYSLFGALLRNAKGLVWNNVLSMLVIASICYVSYSLGANDVGNAIGPLLNRFPDHGVYLAVLGGVAMATGALTFGQRVTATVGKSITPLDLTGAFAAQASAAAGVHLFSVLGIPVSTSQAVVGAVVGVGLTKGVAAVSRKKITTIASGWVLAPTLAAIFAALVFRLLVAILN
ncbi:MAG: inorganic phosphate transporter [Pseudomonadales bacterium]